MAKRRRVGNLLALAMLAILEPGLPMHPYQMASVLRRTGKDADMQIKWGSLYTVVQNLEKHGFIEVASSDRAGRRPERTAYRITAAGGEELRDWLRELIAEPEPEHPRFEAALSVMAVLGPDEVRSLLERRVRALEESVTAERTALVDVAKTVPRLFLIEAEHALAMREAEAAWVRGLVDELADGTMSGLDQWRETHRTGRVNPEWAQMLLEGEGSPE